MPRIVEGKIEFLKCATCSASTPHFVFSGDVDHVTEGLFSAGKADGPLVVLAELTPSENLAVVRGDFDSALDRLSRDSGVGDLHSARFLRSEGGVSPQGVSFAEFRKRYRPPDLIYACPHCEGGEAVSSDSLTASEFREIGGQIITVGDLAVSDE